MDWKTIGKAPSSTLPDMPKSGNILITKALERGKLLLRLVTPSFIFRALFQATYYLRPFQCHVSEHFQYVICNRDIRFFISLSFEAPRRRFVSEKARKEKHSRHNEQCWSLPCWLFTFCRVSFSNKQRFASSRCSDVLSMSPLNIDDSVIYWHVCVGFC